MTPSAVKPARDPRWLALVVLCAGTLMTILDGTIVTVALPSIQKDLGFSQSSLAWVVNAYMIPFGGLLLLAGRAGDLGGRKRVFVAGLGVFTAASLWCGLSASQAMLITARFAQGVGGAMTTAVVLGMVITMFPEPRLQAKAIGVYSFAGAAGASVGVLAGGVITQAINWHWIFFVNVPLGIAAMALAIRVVEPDRGIGLAAGADALGALLVTAGLMLGVATIVGTTRYGWVSGHTLGSGAVAAVLLGGFVVRQATAARPLLPLRMFRSRNVSGANLVQALMVAGMLGFQFVVPLYLRRVLGYSPAQTGLSFLPVTVAEHALRPARDAAREPADAGGRARAAHPRLRARAFRHGPAAGARAAGHRRGPRPPRGDDAGHVRRQAGGLRRGVRPGQHHAAGRRRGRRRGRGHAGHLA